MKNSKVNSEAINPDFSQAGNYVTKVARNFPMYIGGGYTNLELRLPHIHISGQSSLLDILTFFERVNNASRLSLIHNTRNLKVRTSSSIATSILDDSALTVVNSRVAESNKTVSTEIYDHYSPAGMPEKVVGSRTIASGTRGYNVAEIMEFFETALTGSANIVAVRSTRNSIIKISGSQLAANLRKLAFPGEKCEIDCTEFLDQSTLDVLASVLHHYYMIYNAFIHVNAYIYMVNRGATPAEKRNLVRRSSAGLCAQSSLMDVMGILPSTLLMDVHSIIDGISRKVPIKLNHVHDVARFSSYIALLHTYSE